MRGADALGIATATLDAEALATLETQKLVGGAQQRQRDSQPAPAVPIKSSPTKVTPRKLTLAEAQQYIEDSVKQQRRCPIMGGKHCLGPICMAWEWKTLKTKVQGVCDASAIKKVAAEHEYVSDDTTETTETKA